MSIEIKQLHVRSQIVQRRDEEQRDETVQAQLEERDKALLEQCRRMVLGLLKREKER